MTKTNLIAEPGKQEIRVTRVFDAPRDLVFRAWTNPQHIPQWWGPKRLTTLVDKMDVKAGDSGNSSNVISRGMSTHFMGCITLSRRLNGLCPRLNSKVCRVMYRWKH